MNPDRRVERRDLHHLLRPHGEEVADEHPAHVLDPVRRAVSEEHGARRRDGIHDPDHGLLGDVPRAGARQRQDESADGRGDEPAGVRLPRVELNGIDFGHGHLAETLLWTQDPQQLERARVEVLDFIFSAPRVPPDEEQVAPTYVRLVWEVQKTFNWAHELHRSIYDVLASDRVDDKDAAIRGLLANYLEKPEAITSHRLDHHGKLWSLPESKSFREKAPKFNVQIWSYHWLQAAAHDLQLMGNAARQRELMPRPIEHYHGYLRRPPLEWQFMPMMAEGAPEFSRRFPETAAIFDNLHMLHDNIDDVLSRPDLYPTREAQRAAILRILPVYLHRNHAPEERYAKFHGMAMAGMEHGRMQHMMKDMGPRPPSAREVLEGRTSKGTEQHPGAGH